MQLALALEMPMPHKPRTLKGLPTLGYIMIHGEKQLVRFREYNNYRVLRLRDHDLEIDGHHLVITEQKLSKDKKKLQELLAGDMVAI